MELLLITQAQAPAIAPGFTVALPAGGQRWARWNPAVTQSKPVWECGVVGEGRFHSLMLPFNVFIMQDRFCWMKEITATLK